MLFKWKSNGYREGTVLAFQEMREKDDRKKDGSCTGGGKMLKSSTHLALPDPLPRQRGL